MNQGQTVVYIGSGVTPKPSWSRERGDGYCDSRSRSHRRRLGHLFTSRQTVNGAATSRCCWCWKATR